MKNENINDIIRRAYANSSNPDLKISDSLSLKEATLNGAWNKHGFHSTAGSFVKNVWYDPETTELSEQEWTEELLFQDATANYKGDTHKGKWRISLFAASKNLAILKLNLSEAGICYFQAFMNAAALKDLPKNQICTVQALGPHPTLVTAGEPQETNIITAIIELDGSLDPDLGDARNKLKGEPVLVTWFPGPQLPISEPHDCAVGDTLNVEEAIQKGWKTVAFECN